LILKLENFFKYLSVSEEENNWGFYLNVIGTSLIAPKTEYPSKAHPAGYYFNWSNGRILNEFQLNYITEGEGILENAFGRFQIKPGTLMITFPEVWHRYRPVKKTGWVENYIGFDGSIARKLLKNQWFRPDQPLINCGIHEEFIDCFYKVFDLVRKEKPGFQYIASGLVIKLLGYIISYRKQRDFSGKHIESVIEEARFIMRQNIEQPTNIQELAKKLHIGYSYFRKMFKKYTGFSPRQYHIHLKIMQAKELLLISNKSIKEISFEMGFNSNYYFSRLFKSKVGISPSDFKNNMIFSRDLKKNQTQD